MDESRYHVRPFRDDDFETASRINTLLNPDFPVTADEIRHWDRLFREPNLVKLDFIVEERSSGAGVARASIYHVPEMFHPHRFWVEIEVDPGHQHRGIGRALSERLQELARARSVEILWASVRADDLRSVQFFERAGFVERRRRWMSRLSLDIPPPVTGEPRSKGFPPEVTFTTLAEEGADRREVRERVYRLDLAASEDEPRMDRQTEISFEQYAAIRFQGPGFLPEAVFLARAGDEYVAMSTLHPQPAEPTVLVVGFTGTLPRCRGRGLASELKRRAVEFARARGYRYLQTFNDSENPPIWAINQRLGFQIQRVWITGEKKFAPEPGSSPTP